MNNKIAVIGGSGFVGSRFLKDVETENCYIIDKNISPFYPELTRKRNICDEGLADFIDRDTKQVVLLAAEHRDDVSPASLYYQVNVEGTLNVLAAMDHLNIKQIVFTSSVAVYGLNKENPDEDHPADPFNHYGKSKWQAEEALRKWYHKDPANRSLVILRPTVIFGERNRGNVYNLLRQIASGRFLMIGKGKNKKSMAYVGNVTAFLHHCLSYHEPGYRVYNYIDKPDLDMNELLDLVRKKMDKPGNTIRIPQFIGMLGGFGFDLLSWITKRNYTISSVRVKKFCATTQFDASKIHDTGFKAPYSLREGLEETLQFEFRSSKKDTITFVTE